MDNTAFAAAGGKLYVSDTLPATHDQSGYEALTWTQVDGVSSVGDFGGVYSVVPHSPLAGTADIKSHGSLNNGSTVIGGARVSGDSGQGKIEAAFDSKCNISFKFVHSDVPCTGGIGTTEYFDAKVFSIPSVGLGGANNIDGISYSLEINTSIVKVAAS